MSRPRDYAGAIRHMRKLEQAQRALRLSRSARLEGRPADGSLWPLPAVTQAVLQRELHVNATRLTALHLALAFCRNRYRKVPPASHFWSVFVAQWIRALSKGTGWTNANAVAAQYEQWSKWCSGEAEPPHALPWQREFLRRERKARQARRAARKAAASTLGKGDFAETVEPQQEVRP